MSQSQLFPPAPAAELQTADFLSSIFIDWLSERDIVDKTAFPVFIPFDRGIRVAVERDDCTSVPCWKKGKEKLDHIFISHVFAIVSAFCVCIYADKLCFWKLKVLTFL